MTAVTVTDHGAIGDGEALETEAIQAAIDTCADAGGGRVRVPAGEYVSGTLELHSHVTLDLESGARLLGSPEVDDYRDAGGPLTSLIAAIGASNVAVTGQGTIDGQATAFMDMDSVIDPRDDPATDAFVHEARQGEAFMSPEHGTEDGPVEPLERPDRTLLFYGCTDVSVQDVTICGAPCWTLHILGCEEVDVRGIDVLNEILVPNSDGINPECSRNVRIANCTVATGDDAICPKASDDYDVSGPLENLTVTNCTLVSRSSAVKFGSSTDHDMRDCTFSNLVIRDSNRGLGIQHRDGGTIENVLFSDIVIETRLHTGNWWGMAEPIYVTSVPRHEDHDLGTVRDIHFSNVVAESEGGIVIRGSEESAVEALSFDDVSVTVTDSPNGDAKGGNVDLRPTSALVPIFAHDVAGLHARHVDGLDLAGVEVRWADEPDYCSHGIECTAFEDVTIDGFEGRGAHDAAAIALRDGHEVTVRGSRAAPGTGTFLEVSDTADERLFLGNDLTEADTPIEGEAAFTEVGNLIP